MRQILGGVLIWAVVALAGWAGLSEMLGAHPFWAVKIAVIGGGLGAVAGAVFPCRATGLLGVLMLILAFGVAGFGKARFAASYAEDHFAGRMWFFGAIGVAAAIAVLGWFALHLALSQGGARASTR